MGFRSFGHHGQAWNGVKVGAEGRNGGVSALVSGLTEARVSVGECQAMPLDPPMSHRSTKRAARPAAQPQIVEKLARGGVQRRSARAVAVANDLDPLSLLQLLEQRRGHGHAAHLLDVAPRHRLAVRNDGQRFPAPARE